MKNSIYFNTTVSNYFDVPFSNKGKECSLEADSIIACPIVTWDIDTRKMLETVKNETLDLSGQGDGVWVIKNIPAQGKPDTEKWNSGEGVFEELNHLA